MIDTAVILAGGLGTRLRPLTDETPKPLLPIKGKPILQHAIEHLKRRGITRIVLSIGFEGEKIKSYFQDGKEFGVSITYSIETEPLGTGGAVKKVLQGIIKPVFVIWGDNLMDINYRELHDAYLQHKTPVTMALTPREDVHNFGVAELQGDKIIRFVEKPAREKAPSNLINAGAIVLDPSCLQLLPEGKSSIEYDLYEKLKPGEITAFIHTGQWFPTDTLEKYQYANESFQPFIDLPLKKILIADVDGTICDSCQVIAPEMAQQIDRLIQKGYTWVFISGTNSAELQRMISSQLKGEHHLLGTTGTNYTVITNGSSQKVYTHQLTEEEKREIVGACEKLAQHYGFVPYTSKEDQILDRHSQITFSATGRGAPSEVKATFDPDGKKRQEWIVFLRQYLDPQKYEITIGGTTSVDITRKGMDKLWGIQQFLQHHRFSPQQVLYFGDKLHPGGNDYPATQIVDCIAVRNPEDTLQQLRRLL